MSKSSLTANFSTECTVNIALMDVAEVLNQSKPRIWCRWPKWANQEDGCTFKLTCLSTVARGVLWYINKRRCEHRKERTVKILRVKSWFQGYPQNSLFILGKCRISLLWIVVVSYSEGSKIFEALVSWFKVILKSFLFIWCQRKIETFSFLNCRLILFWKKWDFWSTCSSAYLLEPSPTLSQYLLTIWRVKNKCILVAVLLFVLPCSLRQPNFSSFK